MIHLASKCPECSSDEIKQMALESKPIELRVQIPEYLGKALKNAENIYREIGKNDEIVIWAIEKWLLDRDLI
jgi:hypothetical protein